MSQPSKPSRLRPVMGTIRDKLRISKSAHAQDAQDREAPAGGRGFFPGSRSRTSVLGSAHSPLGASSPSSEDTKRRRPHSEPMGSISAPRSPQGDACSSPPSGADGQIHPGVELPEAEEGEKFVPVDDSEDVPEAPGHFHEPEAHHEHMSLEALGLPALFGWHKHQHAADPDEHTQAFWTSSKSAPTFSPPTNTSPSRSPSDEHSDDPYGDVRATAKSPVAGPGDDYFAFRPRRGGPRADGEGEESDEGSDPERWSLLSADRTTTATAANGAPAQRRDKQAPSTKSKALRELEQVELQTYLQNFGRHTREVRLAGSGTRFMRMPRWSDFVYSSSSDEEEDEDEEGHWVSRYGDRPVRSRLLTHIDRGLQHLQPESPSSSDLDRSPSSRSNASSPNGLRSRSPDRGSRRARSPRPSSPGADTRRRAADCAVQALPESVTNCALSRAQPSGSVTPRARDSGEGKERRTSKELPRVPSPSDAVMDEVESALASPWETAHPEPPKKQARVVVQPHEEHVHGREGRVDGVAFCIAYILALLEQYTPDDLDDAPIIEYRESRARSHIERLYIIAPFWEGLAHTLRSLYRWENEPRTAAAAMIYFVLW